MYSVDASIQGGSIHLEPAAESVLQGLFPAHCQISHPLFFSLQLSEFFYPFNLIFLRQKKQNVARGCFFSFSKILWRTGMIWILHILSETQCSFRQLFSFELAVQAHCFHNLNICLFGNCIMIYCPAVIAGRKNCT